LNLKANYELILTEDCFLIFEKLDSGNGKIVFWSSLFAITDLQLNKRTKVTTINFYDEETNSDYQIKLKIENILLFRDSLVKKMRSLKVKVESQKLIKGQNQYKRLSEKEIKGLKINDIEKNAKELNERINKGEINDYNVKTFTTLCGKAIEYFSSKGDDKYIEYMEMMKNVLKLEGVDKLTKDDENEIKEFSDK
jgi:formylmethanofuran dehydrogenase subunit E-like metal-binding protein